jgi:hypothetical protein
MVVSVLLYAGGVGVTAPPTRSQARDPRFIACAVGMLTLWLAMTLRINFRILASVLGPDHPMLFTER